MLANGDKALIEISAPFLLNNTSMPGSYDYFKADIKQHFLSHVSVQSKILDVGAGCGTYAVLLKPEYQLDAVEIWDEYIHRFNLHSLYDNVFSVDILNFDFSDYDYLIFGDVLEHMSVESAQMLLEKINDTGKRCIVAVPYLLEQGTCEGNHFETHLQPDLTHEVFMERYPYMCELFRNEQYGYYCNYLVNRVNKLEISSNYWLGEDCLKNGVPWMVPGAVYELDVMLNDKDFVLEVGSGGSTIFFAQRCREVTSLETDSNWFEQVQNALKNKSLKNVNHVLSTTQESLCNLIQLFPLEQATILVVDTVHGYNRSQLLDLALSKCPKLRIIVLDNYFEEELYPIHFNWKDENFYSILDGKWRSIIFDDPMWCGRGTKIFLKSD